MVFYGLELGLNAFTNSSIGWWSGDNIKGNWNCVCNSGLTMGALAILGDDTSGTAEAILAKTIPNALQNCIFAVSSDGTWAETANYWYFGTLVLCLLYYYILLREDYIVGGVTLVLLTL